MRIQAKIIHPNGVGGVSSEDRLITTRAALEAALEDLCAYNAAYLTLQPRLPDIYATSIYYKSEPPGEENWLTYPVLLAIGFGDCLPLSTLVLRDDMEVIPLASAVPGTRIMGHGGWTTVLAAAITGQKPILTITLGNGGALRCSPEHRLFRLDGSEVRAEEVAVGERLLTAHEEDLVAPRARPLIDRGLWMPKSGGTVLSVQELPSQLCGDITTDQGRFWLPESDLIVHNCEDLACARVAKLRQQGERKAKPYLYNKGSLWHVMLKRQDGTVEDPSAALGMNAV